MNNILFTVQRKFNNDIKTKRKVNSRVRRIVRLTTKVFHKAIYIANFSEC